MIPPDNNHIRRADGSIQTQTHARATSACVPMQSVNHKHCFGEKSRFTIGAISCRISAVENKYNTDKGKKKKKKEKKKKKKKKQEKKKKKKNYQPEKMTASTTSNVPTVQFACIVIHDHEGCCGHHSNETRERKKCN